MQVGQPITQPGEPMSQWRFVEADLYGITERVKEYDDLAALIRNDETGSLGIARKVDMFKKIAGYEWVVALDMELTGEPDGRVIQKMRETDNRNIYSMKDYYNALGRAGERAEYREAMEMKESLGDAPERAAHAMHRDMGRTNRAYIKRGI